MYTRSIFRTVALLCAEFFRKAHSRRAVFPAITIWVLVLSTQGVRAQFTPGHIALNSDNTVVTSLPANTALFLWSPGNSALRFGFFDTQSASSAIGQYSVAGGYCSVASGTDSIALGHGSRASNTDAIALGLGSTATGQGSLAVNGGYAPGTSAVSIGQNSCNGSNSVAIGACFNDGSNSVIVGRGWIEADNAVIVGGGYVGADSGVAIGGGEAEGENSVAAGWATAPAYGSVALGVRNLGLQKDNLTVPDPSNTSPNDPIFEVGNGDGASNGPNNNGYNNAMTIYRDGTIRMYKACGGISMGNFN